MNWYSASGAPPSPCIVIYHSLTKMRNYKNSSAFMFLIGISLIISTETEFQNKITEICMDCNDKMAKRWTDKN